MRVLGACSLGGAGHLNPLLPLLAAARRQGAETLVVGPAALSEMVQATDNPFRPGGEPPEEVVAPIRELLPVTSSAEASVLGNRELFGRVATQFMLLEMEKVVAEWNPDLILRDPCEYSSAIVAGCKKIPVAQVAISLAEAEAASIRTASPALEEHRLGLVEELWAAPYLSRFPASLDPSPFPITIRYRKPSEALDEPIPDWWERSDVPLIYMTFGTVLGHMSIAGRTFRTALQAIEDLDARVLLTVGRKFDPETLGPVPTNVYIERWVEQTQILEKADIVVCHGGSGTALGALAAGVPLVIVPVFADQFENGRRIAAVGAGRVFEVGGHDPEGNRRQLAEEDAPGIRQEIETVLTDNSFRRAAGLVGVEMAAFPTAAEVLADLN